MWIESHQELGSHPKTIKLARLLGIPKAQVVGHLHYLWWWAMDYAQDGDLSRFDSLDIAVGSDWEQGPDVWLAGLERVGFVDVERDENGDLEGRVIHDWPDYAGKLIERREANAERMREARAKQKEERAAHVQGTQRARAGLPNLTVPNQTIPDHTEPKKRAADKPPKEPKYTPEFESFWLSYPRKTAKYTAFVAWQKVRPDAPVIVAMHKALEWQRETWTEPKFIPHPSTWLNQRRWEDERPVVLAGANGRAGPKLSNYEISMANIRAAFGEPEQVIETTGVVR